MVISARASSHLLSMWNLFVVSSLLFSRLLPSDAAIFDHTDEQTAFRLWIPDDAPQIRGVYFILQTATSNTRNAVGRAALQQLCSSRDFGILGAQFPEGTNLWRPDRFRAGEATLRAMEAFAQESVSGHPELAHSAFFFEGASWGGQLAYTFTVWNPNRVLGFITMKGGYHFTGPPGNATLVPGYMFVGGQDRDYRIDNLVGIHETNRADGARWALGYEATGGHRPIKDRDLLDPFFLTVVDMRLPAGPLPEDAPPQLAIIPEESGFLGDNDRRIIGSYDCLLEGELEKPRSSWLPTRSLIQDWQVFVSEDLEPDPVNDCSEESYLCEIPEDMNGCQCGCVPFETPSVLLELQPTVSPVVEPTSKPSVLLELQPTVSPVVEPTSKPTLRTLEEATPSPPTSTPSTGTSMPVVMVVPTEKPAASSITQSTVQPVNTNINSGAWRTVLRVGMIVPLLLLPAIVL